MHVFNKFEGVVGNGIVEWNFKEKLIATERHVPYIEYISNQNHKTKYMPEYGQLLFNHFCDNEDLYQGLPIIARTYS